MPREQKEEFFTTEQEKELFTKCWEICSDDRCVCIGSPTNCGNAQMKKIREKMLDVQPLLYYN